MEPYGVSYTLDGTHTAPLPSENLHIGGYLVSLLSSRPFLAR